MAIAFPIRLIDGTASVTSAVGGGDACAIGTSENSQLLVALSCSDSLSVALSEVSSDVATVTVTDSLTCAASETVQSVIDINTASLSVTDSLRVNASNEPATPSVTVSVVDSFPGFNDEVSSLQVFTGSSVNNISVSDSLRVRLNGIEPPAPTIPVSVTDALRIDLSGLGTRTISVLASDSLAVRGTDTASTPIVSVTTTDSMRLTALEPDDQQSYLGVLESLTIEASDTARIEGSFAFNVTDGLTVGLSESSSFGACTVGATDSCRTAASEVLTNTASVSAADSLRTALTDVVTAFKALALTDALAVQVADTAAPIFDSFVDITASDSCAVQASESVTELVSFLRQLTASDAIAVGHTDSLVQLFVDAVASESLAASADEAVSIWDDVSVADSLKVGTTEQGLAIPIVSVNVSTFADDTILGEIDGNATIAVVYEAIEKTASDSFGTQVDEESRLQAGYYADDTCLVGVSESASDTAVANASPETWNGCTGTEHRNDKPKPWKYIFTDKHHW